MSRSNRATSAVSSHKQLKQAQEDVRPMSILTTAPIHTKIDIQIKLADNSEEKSGNSPTKSAPNSPVKRVTPLTLETAVELKYDLQETIIPYPQVEDSSRMIRDDQTPSPLISNLRDEIMATRRRASNIQR